MTVGLRVGQDFAGDAVPRSAELLDQFTIRDGGGQRAIEGFENLDPAGYLRIEKPGLAVIGYRSKPYPLELPAEKFNLFLQQEGLDAIRELRAKRGETNQPDRERFVRYAKALVGRGNARFDRPLGYRLEIVPETSPFASTALRLRLLYEGRPLRNALVTAIHRNDPNARLSSRTDAHGRVTFSLPKNGVWLIKSVHMIAAPPGANVEWESLWASLTFER